MDDAAADSTTFGITWKIANNTLNSIYEEG